jgi:hypothetical protein
MEGRNVGSNNELQRRFGCRKGRYEVGSGPLDQQTVVVKRERVNLVVRVFGLRHRSCDRVVVKLHLVRPGMRYRLTHRDQVREDSDVRKEGASTLKAGPMVA